VKKNSPGTKKDNQPYKETAGFKIQVQERKSNDLATEKFDLKI
jgi:hypothetical protein